MKKILSVLLIVCFSLNAKAKDMGVIAKTYPIKEQNIITVMKNKMAEKTQSGEIQKKMNLLKKRTKRYVNRPKGIKLPDAIKYNAERVDVRYELDKNIIDNNGKILYRKGKIINPLEIYPMSFGLCFIDGDKKKHVEFAKKRCYPKERIVLVNGDYAKVAQQLNIRVYFDQRSYLTQRFNLQRLPTVIRQSGNYMVKEEFVAQ